ncbi:MAG: hypothetical protein ABI451_01270 [Dokdonella sp.]
MKRNSLTTAVIAGIAGVAGFASLANAVDLNADGLGQVLLYPYYTVNNGQQTLLSVVNTTQFAKAVKVRFLEGHNSREVLDFNLFLSRYDVWTATVFALNDFGLGSNGGAIATADKSCTAPSILALPTIVGTQHYQPFLPFAYTGDNSDSGPSNIERTREGHFEMIAMADLLSPYSGYVTHVQNGIPNGGVVSAGNCGQVVGSIPESFLAPPTSGLFGNAGVVNVGQGTFFTYEADAIDGFTGVQIFSEPSFTTPTLQFANDDTNNSPFATAYVFQNGNLITSTYDITDNRGIDAVSAVIDADAIYNEWIVGAGLAANSDWVVNFPTKRFYVDPQIVGYSAIPPFVYYFGEHAGSFNGNGLSCVVIGLAIYDQEEGTPAVTPGGFSPPPPGQPPSALCKETNVISFLKIAAGSPPPSQSGVLGSTLVTNVQPYGDAGWLKLNLNPSSQQHNLRPSFLENNVFHGLPVNGFWASNIVNGNAGGAGILANYAGVWRHRSSRDCSRLTPGNGNQFACS